MFMIILSLEEKLKKKHKQNTRVQNSINSYDIWALWFLGFRFFRCLTGYRCKITLNIFLIFITLGRTLRFLFLLWCHWSQILFTRMGFKKRMQTTGKVKISESTRKRLNCYIFATSSRLSRVTKSLIH